MPQSRHQDFPNELLLVPLEIFTEGMPYLSTNDREQKSQVSHAEETTLGSSLLSNVDGPLVEF